MKKAYSRIVLSFALVFAAHIGFAQGKEISIKFIGNCGLYMTDGETNVYSDFPYKSGAFNYMEFDDAELDSVKENSIFIFTHKHPDHYSSKNMKRVLREKNGQKYGSWNIKELEQLGNTIPNFSVQAFKTKHRFSFKHYSYLITWHGKKIFLSGDTESAEIIGNISGIDWAFVPYWVVLDANEKNIKIDAKRRGLYHLYPNQKMTGKIPEDMILLQNQNEIISIPY